MNLSKRVPECQAPDLDTHMHTRMSTPMCTHGRPTHVHPHMHTCVHVHTRTPTLAHILIHGCTFTRACLHANSQCIHMHILAPQAKSHTSSHTHMQTHTCTHMNEHMSTLTL